MQKILIFMAQQIREDMEWQSAIDMKISFLPVIIIIALLSLQCSGPQNLDTDPPVVTVVSPTDMDETGAPVLFQFNATDNVGVVSVILQVDGMVIEKKDRPPYTFYWNSDYWGDGEDHVVQAMAADPSGNFGYSDKMKIEVMKTRKPFISSVFPKPFSSVADSNVQFSWDSIPNTSRYQIMISDTLSFRNPIMNTVEYPHMSFLLPSKGTYYWKILPISHGNTEGEWSKPYVFHRTEAFTSIIGTKEYDSFSHIVESVDNGFMAVGSIYQQGISSGWLVKLSAYGDREWEQIFPKINDSWFTSIHTLREKGYIIAGTSTSENEPGDVWVVKTDTVGMLGWEKSFLTPEPDGAYDILQTRDNALVLCGYRRINDSTRTLVMKLQMNGDTVWTAVIDGYFFNEGHSIVEGNDGSLYVAGYVANGIEQNSEDAFVAKFSPDGVLEWKRTYGDSLAERAQQIITLPNNELAFCGHSRSFGNGSQDAWVVKIDQDGSVVWQQSYPRYEEFTISSISALGVSRFFVCGSYFDTTKNATSAFLGTIDQYQDTMEVTSYSREHSDAALYVIKTGINEMALVGYSNSPAGGTDAFFIRTDSFGRVLHNRRTQR